MTEISSERQQRTGWAIIAAVIALPVLMVVFGVDLEPIVDEILSGF